MKRSLTIFLTLVIIGIILLGWWKGWYLWLEEHDTILSALIQVVGLLIIGFLVNKWLADYNERKTARLERYKLQRQISEDLPRLLMKGMDYSIRYALAKFNNFHAGEDKELEERVSAEIENYNKLREDQVYGLIVQRILCMTAFKNYDISRKVDKIKEILLCFPNRVKEIVPKYNLDEEGAKFYDNDITELLRPVQDDLNDIVTLIANEISEWIEPDRGKAP